MMDKEKLRKADILSGSLIVLLGLYIISQAVQMPMKDSWGEYRTSGLSPRRCFPFWLVECLPFSGFA